MKKLILFVSMFSLLFIFYLVSPVAFSTVTQTLMDFLASPTLINSVSAVSNFITSALSNIATMILGSGIADFVRKIFIFTIFAIIYGILYIMCIYLKKFCKVLSFVFMLIPYFVFTECLLIYNDAITSGESAWGAGFKVFPLIAVTLAVSFSGVFLDLQHENILRALLYTAIFGIMYAVPAFIFLGIAWTPGLYVVGVLSTISSIIMLICPLSVLTAKEYDELTAKEYDEYHSPIEAGLAARAKTWSNLFK